MKKILFLLAALAAIIGMFLVSFAMVFLAIGLLGLAVDYLEMIILAAILIVGLWVIKRLYSLACYCFGIAATLALFSTKKQ